MMVDGLSHEESWQLLPWLANGRLAPGERARLEEHVRGCGSCAQELTQQRLLCQALTEPERVTYAPGPSFRKLMDRIDGRTARPRLQPRPAVVSDFPQRAASLWRPPGLAWAASVLLVVGGAAWLTAYRWTQPLYTTYTAAAVRAPDVLHIAFVPSLSIGDAGRLLREAGARVVEGPDATGIFGVAPVERTAGDARTEDPSPQMRELAARLRADARVRWVEPLGAAGTSGSVTERHSPRL